MTTGTHTESKRRFVTRDLLVVVPLAIVLGAMAAWLRGRQATEPLAKR